MPSLPPSGYEVRVDPEGFRIAVPEGWERDAVPSQYGFDVVNYRSPEGDRRVQVFEIAEVSPDDSFALFRSADTPKPDGYRELSFEELPTSRVTGARLEYMAASIGDEPDVGTWHAVDARFTAMNGGGYAVAAYGRDADGREDEFALMEVGVEWFCPPDGLCG
ncbi:hypothetical protein AB0O01_12265 [Streptomyces sp. NPDC093252]|uniref:hypothetical protein n=1 Tax=Streptomyces sp. NPDC093252 TaxID=3154980 RepID=UPI003443F46B